MASLEVELDELSLRLEGDWRPVPSSDGSQLCFESDQRRASLVVSVMRVGLPGPRLEAVAQQVLSARTDGEARLGGSFQLAAAGPWLERKAEDVVEVGYSGRHRDQVVSFRAVVTTCKVVNVWVSCEGSEASLAGRLLDEVLGAVTLPVP